MSGLSAPIVLTSAELLSMSLSLRPEEQERTDDTVKGHVRSELLLGHDAPALGGLRATPGVRPTSHLQGTFRAHVEEGQAAPRCRPQPFSRILTEWKVNSANFALTEF
jgi:hypothetical protein